MFLLPYSISDFIPVRKPVEKNVEFDFFLSCMNMKFNAYLCGYRMNLFFKDGNFRPFNIHFNQIPFLYFDFFAE